MIRLPATLRSLPPAAVLAAALGCASVGVDYETPAIAVPEGWRDAPQGEAARSAELAGWWHRLGDPLLARLVERATRDGLDVHEALARVREARALHGVAGAERFPTLDAELSYERSAESDNTPLGSFVPDDDRYALGFDASWEVDLWGRVRRSVEAAGAELEASVEDARDAAVSVAAETAARYVELRAFQRRLAIARTNVRLQEETLGLVRARFEVGLVGERDVAQAAANLETTRSRLPALEAGARAAENRLAVLVGEAPGALASELGPPGPIPIPPLEVAVGVPADLLRRRADVRRAERRLAAETARIGVAEGELYPRLTLAGNLGLAADDLGELFEQDSGVLGVGPTLRWNLFDAGALRRRVEAQEARAEQALTRWKRAVLTALEETENALTAFLREQVRHRSLADATAETRRALELARTQYEEGLADFLSVLDSERSLAELEDELVRSEAAITTGLIALYKALGGGWEGAGDTEPRPAP